MGLITGYSDLKIKTENGQVKNRFLHGEDYLNLERKFKQGGFFNGEILGCLDYDFSCPDISLLCEPLKFFDFYYRMSLNKDGPMAVAVNGLFAIENNILLIRRDHNVYCYQGYWDLPAGLVPFGLSLRERIIDRLKADTGIEESTITCSTIPEFLEIRKPFFHTYFVIRTNLLKEDVREILRSNGKEESSVFLKKEEINDFLRLQKRVYPRFLNDFFQHI